MRSFLLSFLTGMLLCAMSLSAQPVLSVSIDIPDISVDPNTQAYTPLPLEVTATIYNTGQSASQQLSARVVLTPGLSLDTSEQDASIKAPVPDIVAAGDSAKVAWKIVYPPAFSPENYRVFVWLKSSPNDSAVTSELFTVPAIAPPDLRLTASGIPALSVRVDSLGYDGNPFDVYYRFSNAGGTAADSVSVELLLPPGYELDPPSQDNPMRLAQPLEPEAQGGQKLYEHWSVRYTAATRSVRNDTFVIRARGKDLAGGWLQSLDSSGIQVPGMNPTVTISWHGPGSLQYDTASIYHPLPYPLILRLTNPSEQWTLLGSALLDIAGEGWSCTDPFSRLLPALAPNSYLEFTWDVDVERRSAPRELDVHVDVTDDEGYTHRGQRSVQIPGKPYALSVEELQLPDSLPRSPDGTQLLSDEIPVRFRVRNDAWYNTRFVYSKLQTQGTGIVSAPWKEQQHADFLLPGGSSPAARDTFIVEPALKDRVVGVHLLAVSDRGDTARASGSVRIPGLQPVLELRRRGPDALQYQPGGTYTPNPFSQEYILYNRGYVKVRVDSLILRYPMDGVSTPQPLRRDIGFDLVPGDSLLTRWDFSAYVRDTLRRIPMHVTAYASSEYAEALQHIVEIPALFPVLETEVRGPDTLAYDPDSLYTPNPFTRTLHVHNGGTADLQLDSVRLEWDDALLHAVSPTLWNAGAVLPPDSSLAIPFTLRADAHEVEKTATLEFTIHHGGSKSDVSTATVFFAALRPGLDVTVLGNAQLLKDASSIYRPDPFLKTVRVANNGTADLQLDSIAVSITDPLLSVIEGRVQATPVVIAPGASEEVEWHFHAAPHASSGKVVIRFTVFHSGGDALPVQDDIFIPGELFSFDLQDVHIPDRLVSRADGQGYEDNPVVIDFKVENAAWFSSLFSNVLVRVEGEGADMLTAQPRNPALALNPQAFSPVMRDSFFVFPATYDRVLRVSILVENNRGLVDSIAQEIFVPRVTSTSADSPPVAGALALKALYPNPLSLNGARVLHATLTSREYFQWEIYDLLGRRFLASPALPPAPRETTLRVPLQNLPAGTYVFRLTTPSRQVSSCFVILD
ncbi:T9SS type A sorting domain-containing protein [bacterium]|nr:T9SS type A sorting domain-containing protein [bacterium]